MTLAPALCVYGLHGLRVRSAIPLAGFLMPGDDSDVDVRWGPSGPVPAHPAPGDVLAACSTEDGYRYVASRCGRHITLRVPGLCDFVIGPDHMTVECRPDPSADHRLVAVLVAGLVVAFVLGLDGHCTLHASAVESEGRAIAIAGDRGMGKSTLAAVLCAAGSRLVTDDVLRLQIDPDGTVSCRGGAPQLRLRPAAAWVLDHFPTPPSVSTTIDGRLAIEPLSYGGVPLPLAAVVLVRPSRATHAVDLRTIRGAEALLRLTAVTRIVGWKDPAVLGRQFDLLGAAAEGVAVVEALVPWAMSPAPPVAASLLALARQP